MGSRRTQLRVSAGTRYAALWRRAYVALQRVAPGSARWWLRDPALPDAPLRREFTSSEGTAIDALYVERFVALHARDVSGRVLAPSGLRLPEAAAPPLASPDTTATHGAPSLGAYDCIVSVDDLNREPDPRAALARLHAALAPGGRLLLAVPGVRRRSLVGVADRPELWRFTSDGLRLLLGETFGADNVAVETHGTVRAAAAALYGVPEHRVPPAALQPPDPDFDVVVAAVAVKRSP